MCAMTILVPSNTIMTTINLHLQKGCSLVGRYAYKLEKGTDKNEHDV